MSLDAWFRKYFALVVLALSAVAAYFQSATVSRLFGALLAPPADVVATVPSADAAKGLSELASAPHGEGTQRAADPILQRNLFDSKQGPISRVEEPDGGPEPTELGAGGPVDTSNPLSAPGCDGVNVLIVTESTDPTWSVAAIQANGEAKPSMRRVGDEVNGKQVAFIGYNRLEASPAVWFQSGGSLCQALLFRQQTIAAAAPTAKGPPAASGAAPGGAPSALQQEIASKIQKVGENEFNVDRAVVDKILENQAELMRSARIVPEQENGKTVGIRLFGIRPDTLLGTLGLQNGDRLESINGFNMASPEKALEAYARLRTASGLKVQVNRRGAPVTIDFHIK